MDSLTQAVLGGAVGAASGGPKLGRRAIAWGAVAGTIPDLDILAYPFLDPAGQLYIHRGLTHGLAFAFAVGPVLGWLVWRFYRWRGRADDTWRAWTGVFFWGLITHPLLDVFTIYGTQLLAPFSDHPFAVGSVFIIDPVVTVALAVGLGVALWAGQKPLARWVTLAGMAVSLAYLGLGVVLQAQARATVETALEQRGIEAERVLVASGPLSSFIWRGVALEEGRITPLSLHVTDPPEAVQFAPPVPAAVLPPEVAASRPGRTLLWFSRGWLTALPGDGPDSLRVADVRFGRLGLDADDPWVFQWDIAREAPHGFRQRAMGGGFEDGEIGRLWQWILGQRPDPEP